MRQGLWSAALVFGMVCGAGVPGNASAQPGTIVVLVRHAEKAAAPANDPALTAAGEARAVALGAALAGARIDTIVTTQFARTRLTAAPMAAARGLTPIVIQAGSDTAAHVQAIADAVRARPAGEAVLVVGHSNTVPAIIAALGGPKLPELCDSEYASLFVLSIPAAGPARLIRSGYGAPDGPPTPGCGGMMRQD